MKQRFTGGGRAGLPPILIISIFLFDVLCFQVWGSLFFEILAYMVGSTQEDFNSGSADPFKVRHSFGGLPIFFQIIIS